MSSPPPPPIPPNTTTTTVDLLKSVARHRPRQHTHPAIYQTFYTPHSQPLTPTTQHVNANGRGFFPKHLQSSVHSGGFPPRAAVSSGYPNSHQTLIATATATANPKVVGQSPAAAAAAADSIKSIRDKNGDDAFVIIRDRKVQVSEGTSLYAQCRSWLKNGVALENQTQHVDYVKSLPKPLPASIMVEARKEDDMEIEEEEDEITTQDVENMSAKELLQLHVKHAKKVRARKRSERLQRIERYKERLALLLPPVVDQQPKNNEPPAF